MYILLQLHTHTHTHTFTFIFTFWNMLSRVCMYIRSEYVTQIINKKKTDKKLKKKLYFLCVYWCMHKYSKTALNANLLNAVSLLRGS